MTYDFATPNPTEAARRVVVSIAMTEEMKERLDVVAERLNKSRSQFVREVLEFALEQVEKRRAEPENVVLGG